jgi:hypothetical protein
MRRATVCLLFLLIMAAVIPAWAHGTSQIREHRFAMIDGEAKARGTYVVSRKHAHIFVTVFIVEAGSGRITEEKTRHCDSGGCKHVRVQTKIACVRTLAYYAVIQGDVRAGGHFALWNSKTLVCE